jgi:hypothetical protein
MDKLSKYTLFQSILFELEILHMEYYSTKGVIFPEEVIPLLTKTDDLLSIMYSDDKWDKLNEFMENINLLTTLINGTING